MASSTEHTTRCAAALSTRSAGRPRPSVQKSKCRNSLQGRENDATDDDDSGSDRGCGDDDGGKDCRRCSWREGAGVYSSMGPSWKYDRRLVLLEALG